VLLLASSCNYGGDCGLSQSALMSGSNLAVFGIGWLRLEAGGGISIPEEYGACAIITHVQNFRTLPDHQDKH